MPELTALLEGILFAAPEPVALEDLASGLDLSREEVAQGLRKLHYQYQEDDRGLRLKAFEGRFTLTNKAEVSRAINQVLAAPKRVSLTEASLETLAIVAYHQPVTRTEIEEIRGVSAEQTLRTLSRHNLVTELGRREQPGNPIEYGTTEEFLYHFDLQNLSHLPDREEIRNRLKQEGELPASQETSSGEARLEAESSAAAENTSAEEIQSFPETGEAKENTEPDKNSSAGADENTSAGADENESFREGEGERENNEKG